MFFACCLLLVCHSPLNCSSQIYPSPISLICVSSISLSFPHAHYLPLQANIQHVAGVLKTYCSVGGIRPPCLYSHRLCSRNIVLCSIPPSESLFFVWILLGFKSVIFFHSLVNIYHLAEYSVIGRATVFY